MSIGQQGVKARDGWAQSSRAMEGERETWTGIEMCRLLSL